MTWIRLDCEMPGNTKTMCFRERLNIPISQAVGHLALIFMWLAREHWEGDLSHVKNAAVEDAAVWRGEKGELALAFRDYFCEHGKVKGWLERQGKLVAYKRRADNRKRTTV